MSQYDFENNQDGEWDDSGEVAWNEADWQKFLRNADKEISKFISAYKIGFEQLLIFCVTTIATLRTNIVLGVLIGALSTLISHLIITRDPLLFFLNVFKPNVLAFKEPEEDTYFVSVKHYCTFLNFYKLQKKLDAIGYTKKVVLEVSLC